MTSKDNVAHNGNLRIYDHPILSSRPSAGSDNRDPCAATIFWNGAPLPAKAGEMLSSALFAQGIRTFGHHHIDGAPQGIFCANGQCSQCLVIVDGIPAKACMTPVQDGMQVFPAEGLPELPPADPCDLEPQTAPPLVRVPVLIIGGGPAGMSASISLAGYGIDCLLVDDKQRLGGKLVLQTHRFFGSADAVYAGTRGTDIATKLEAEVVKRTSIDVWINSTVVGVFSDGKVGVLRNGDTYALIQPEVLLVASGAREKSLAFPGNTLPGVYGAGAFQTLVNRDLVRAAERLFIVGGGNVGLIAGYHALQAGIAVVGLVEAMPACGGYKVHRDKLARFGVPIWTSHTVLSANGADKVESVTIAAVDDKFHPIEGTARSFACDTILIAVGLNPVDEFYKQATAFGIPVFAAGDAEEIAEASAAMFSGKIKGMEIAKSLGRETREIPSEWVKTAQVLKSHPGATISRQAPSIRQGNVIPVFHCSQEIPCNPCASACPQGLIEIDASDMRSIPHFIGETARQACVGCERCVAVCPGLAITLVDARVDDEWPTVTIPFEFPDSALREGDVVDLLDAEGAVLGEQPVEAIRRTPRNDRTALVKVRAPKAWAARVAGFRVQESWIGEPLVEPVTRLQDDTILCRCERVSVGEVRTLIRAGYRDLNEIKAVTRAGMGACGGKTCTSMILRLFHEEGISADEITSNVVRPLFVEVPFGTFAGRSARETSE
ncbi:FAD-dependent oxidoreductase [Candidatus Bipolaricaulota bacterium]|nr:FAD-dependent oxidoreductase [Candidatus Bipolaricaulota bacterium]